MDRVKERRGKGQATIKTPSLECGVSREKRAVI